MRGVSGGAARQTRTGRAKAFFFFTGPRDKQEARTPNENAGAADLNENMTPRFGK